MGNTLSKISVNILLFTSQTTNGWILPSTPIWFESIDKNGCSSLGWDEECENGYKCINGDCYPISNQQSIYHQIIHQTRKLFSYHQLQQPLQSNLETKPSNSANQRETAKSVQFVDDDNYVKNMPTAAGSYTGCVENVDGIETKHGFGKLTTRAGINYEGIFNKGKFTGTQMENNEKTYVGELVYDGNDDFQFDGEGVQYRSNGKIFVGTFKNGNLQDGYTKNSNGEMMKYVGGSVKWPEKHFTVEDFQQKVQEVTEKVTMNNRMAWKEGTKVDVKYDNNVRFVGKKDKQGVVTFPNGAQLNLINGNWNDGEISGDIEIQYRGGGVYKGQSKGRGTYTFDSGTSIQVEYVKDIKIGTVTATGYLNINQRTGNAILTGMAGGKSYDGEIEDGKPNGYGIVTNVDGDEFHGSFENGELDGDGKEIFANKDVMTGKWVRGEIQGDITIEYKNGGSYEGECKGDGIYTTANDDFFDVHYVDKTKSGYRETGYIDSDQSGRVVVKYDNGDSYDGEWVKHERHGHGVYTYANGVRYDGEWKEGKKDGEGEMMFKNGDVYNGEWKNDKRHGYGVLTGRDGRTKYYGKWKDDKKIDGVIEDMPIDGGFYTGHMRMGGNGEKILREGYFKETRTNSGSVYEGMMHDGHLTAVKKDKDGNIEYIGQLSHDEKDGYQFNGDGAFENPKTGIKMYGEWVKSKLMTGYVKHQDGSIEKIIHGNKDVTKMTVMGFDNDFKITQRKYRQPVIR